MSWAAIIVISLASILLLMPVTTWLSSRRMVGREINGAGDGLRLIYFYSDHCPPCRQMAPIIDQLAEEHGNVEKVNISEDAEKTLLYGIRATPTTVLVNGKRIVHVMLGAKSRKQLKQLLEQY